MAKNRKAQTAAVRFGPAVMTFLICLLIGGAGVGYVWQQNKIQLLSEKMRKLELRRDKLRLDRQGLVRKLTALKSERELEAQVKRMNLDLAPVPPDRVVRLPIMRDGLGGRKDEQLFAEQVIRMPVGR